MLRRQRAPRRLAHLLHLVPKKLFKLHEHMHKEASAIACKHYTDDHQVSFDEHGTHKKGEVMGEISKSRCLVL
jgi:hypothetical protein